MFCRCVSRVATIKGASGFSSLSPVEIPTRQFLDFHCAYLSFARARVGTVYVALPPYCEKKSSNTNVFPVPVGACKTTSRPAFMCATASACQKSGIRKAVPNSSISSRPLHALVSALYNPDVHLVEVGVGVPLIQKTFVLKRARVHHLRIRLAALEYEPCLFKKHSAVSGRRWREPCECRFVAISSGDAPANAQSLPARLRQDVYGKAIQLLHKSVCITRGTHKHKY